MPYTLNGFGTMYYGRRDPSVAVGTCSSCGRQTRLSSYETREFFCAIFIPLIPLKKYRILNDCASCRRHLRIPLAEFKQKLESDIAPLRAAVERAPADAEARVNLIAGLMDYQMYVQAEAAAREALNVHPGHAGLNRLMAHLLALRNDLAGATPFYRQAAAAAPKDAEIRFALGHHLFTRGESAEAVRELGEAWRLDPGNSQALYFMAEALFKEKRWNEALDAYQQVAMRHPELAVDKDMLRQMKQCKEALGFPVTDAERKAGRRWWPFGGNRSNRSQRRVAGPAATGVDGKRVAALFAIVIAGTIVVSLGLALWKQRQDDLWIDNGLAEPVRVTLDGETISLSPGAHVLKTVAPGDHPIVVADAKGREMERYTARIARLDLIDALLAERLFVYNVAEARVYLREEIGYAKEAENQTYRRSFVAFQRFFQQDDVDFIFQNAPETIKVESRSSVETRVAFNTTELDANRMAVIWFSEGEVDKALDALRRALRAEPCSLVVHNNLQQALSSGQRHKEAEAEARKWITACPDSNVEAHRALQEARLAQGQRNALLAEYKTRLAGAASGANHYLYARLLNDPDQSIPLYQAAIRLEPGLSWGRVGLAHDLMTLERDAEAAEHLEQVLRMPDHDTSISVVYAMAAIGAGSADRANEVLESLGGEEEDIYLGQARWLLLLARGDYDAAAKRLEIRVRETGDRDPETWRLKTQLLRLQGDDEALGKTLAEGRLLPDLRGIAATLRQERALAAGRWNEAAAALDGLEPGEVSHTDRLFVGLALLLAGDRDKAGQRLAALDAELAQNGNGEDAENRAALLAMTRYLEGRASADAVLAAARRAGFTMLPHAYFVLAGAREAAGDTAGARALYERSRRTALDFNVPYAAAAARAKEAPGASS